MRRTISIHHSGFWRLDAQGDKIMAGLVYRGVNAARPLALREAVLVEGEGADGGPGTGRPRTQRWEDYTQTAIDPDDDCAMWYVGDYVKKGTTSYTSRIGAFRLLGCSTNK